MTKQAQICFWVTWAGTAALAAFLGGQTAWRLFYILTMILAAGVIFMLSVRFLVKISVNTETAYGVTGDRITMTVGMESGFILPLPAVVLSFMSNPRIGCVKKYALTLYPFKKRRLRTELELYCRGVFKVGVSGWRACDYFGVFPTGRRVAAYETIYVLPRILSVSDQPPLPPREEDSNEPSLSGELAGARPYTWTDSMKHIHWKLSVKGEGLYTRQFSGTVRPPVWVILDLTVIDGEDRELMEDKLLETALSLANYLLEATTVYCAAVSEGIAVTRLTSAQEFDDYYKTIGLTEFAGTDFGAALEAMDMEEKGIAWLVTTGVGVPDAVAALLSYGWEVKWINVTPRPDFRGHDAARSYGAAVQHIPPGRDVTDCAWMCFV